MSVDDILKSISRIKGHIDGFTISGGEPFLQVEELNSLTHRLASEYTNDIIIFTGYTLKELNEEKKELMNSITKNISVIIDGEYIEEKNDNIGVRGSSNQQIHIFRNHDRHKNLDTQKRKVQLIEHQKGITVIGIP